MGDDGVTVIRAVASFDDHSPRGPERKAAEGEPIQFLKRGKAESCYATWQDSAFFVALKIRE